MISLKILSLQPSYQNPLLRKKIKDPLLTMTLCAPNEKQNKGKLGQKGLSDNTKVDFGATKNQG